MTSHDLVPIAGALAGTASFLLGIAQLACEHASAPLVQRLTIGLLAMPAAWTAIDCWAAVSGIEFGPDTHGVAFCVGLAAYWGYRRTLGLVTLRRFRLSRRARANAVRGH